MLPLPASCAVAVVLTLGSWFGCCQFTELVGVDTVVCHPCPAGGDCSGGAFTAQQLSIDGAVYGDNATIADASLVVQQRHIAAQPGYWAPVDSNGLLFYKCPRPASCLAGSNGSRSQCAEGYEGVLCTVCSPGYFNQYGVCQLCT